MLEDVGDVFAAEGLKGEGVLEGAGDFFGAVDFAQGDDFLDVMGGVEAFVLQLAGKQLGLRARDQEGQQQSLIAGLFALRDQVLGVIGIGDVLTAIVTAQVGGDEFFVVKE